MERYRLYKDRYQLKLTVSMEREDYEYLKALLGIAGYSVHGLVREMLRDIITFMRGVFGEDLNNLSEDKEYYLRKLFREALLNLSNAVK